MKLSILTLTYNHEEFIGQAIESVLSQDVDFDYEIVIGEDCSMDDTCEIASEYQRRYPEKLRVLRSDINLGGHRNFVRTLNACRGQYVAILDGDDYWTSPHKLRKQVVFLDNHPEYVMCFHNAENQYENGSRTPYIQHSVGEIVTIEDLLVRNFIPNMSIMFRNGLISEFPEWYFELPFGDWPLYILLAQFGNIGYLDEVMGVYRRRESAATAGDSWTGPKREIFWLGELEMYRHLAGYFHGRYDGLIKDAVSLRYYLLAANSEQTGDLRKARSYALRRFKILPFDTQEEQPLKHLARLCTPGLYKFVKSCISTRII